MRINQKGEGEFIHPYTSLSLWLSNGKKNTQHWFVQSSTTYDFIVYFALQREAMDTTTLTQSLFSGWEFSSTPATKPSFAAAPVCSWRTAKGNKRKQKKIGGGARGTHLDFRHIYPTSNYYFIYWKNNRRLLLSPPSLPPSLPPSNHTHLGAHVADVHIGRGGRKGHYHVLFLERRRAKGPGHEHHGAAGSQGAVVLVEAAAGFQQVTGLTYAQMRLAHLR